VNKAAVASTLLLAVAAVAQDPDAPDRDVRCRALALAQDRGELTIGMVVEALADDDEEVARTAAAIVRHEWLELPPALFAALDARPLAAAAFLRELAVAPRPAAAEWVGLRAADIPGRTRDERCLALAAKPAWQPADVEVVVAAVLAGDAGEGMRAAIAVMPPFLASLGLGRLASAVQTGQLAAESLLPWFDRVPDRGLFAVLALTFGMSDAQAASLLRALHERSPELVRKEAAGNLDGDTSLAPRWLPFVGPLLDRPSRIARVDALLADGAADPATRELALRALLDGRVVTDRLLAAADGADGDDGPHGIVRARLLDAAIDRIPASTVLAWLDSDCATATVRALTRRQALEPALERELLRRLREAGTVDGAFCGPAAEAIVLHGSAEAVADLWPLLRGSAAFDQFVDLAARRKAPFLHELLLTELATKPDDVAPEVRARQLQAVALALAARGDRRELQRLVAAARTADAAFVRRCAHWVRPLPAAEAMDLLATAARVADDRAAELVAWAAAAAPDADVQAALLSLWRAPSTTPAAEELREAAVHALVAGPGRSALIAELRAALAAGPLPDAHEALAYALVGSMPSPPSAEDLELAGDLVLLQPRRDPEREALLGERWPDGAHGFPLVAAVANALGAADAPTVRAVFKQAVAAALAHPRHRGIARGRLLVLWRVLQRFPDLQRAVGEVTALLLLALPGAADAPGNGAAHWFARHAAAADGDHDAAGRHAAAAVRHLLRLPSHRAETRWCVGERDPGAGLDAWAALAAAPHHHARLAALARGDDAAATAAARAVREFAGHDAATLATLPPPAPEQSR